MAERITTDTPKIGVNIAATIAKEDIPRSGHRAGSTIVATDGETYVFTINGSTGAGTWVKQT